MLEPQESYAKGFALTAFGVIVLSFDALMIRLIGAEPFDLLFWRGLLFALVIYLWCRFKTPSTPLISYDRPYWLSASLFVISTICFVCAISLTSVANVLVLISIQPLFAAALSRFFLKEHQPLITWLAITLCILAIVWIFKDSWQTPSLSGDILALLCGLTISAKFVNDRATGKRNMLPALISAGVITALISLFIGDPLALSADSWLWLLLYGVVIIPLAFVLITLGPQMIPATDVAMLMLLEVALGPIWVWLWLDEVPSDATLQGGVVIITTMLGYSLLRARKQVGNR